MTDCKLGEPHEHRNETKFGSVADFLNMRVQGLSFNIGWTFLFEPLYGADC